MGVPSTLVEMAEMAENTLKEIEAVDLTKIVEQVPEKYQGAVSFVLVKSFNELIQSEVVANFLADAFNVSVGAATVNPTSLALTQIKKKIDDLQKDVDKLLRSDMETAQESFKMAINYFQNETRPKCASVYKCEQRRLRLTNL